MIRADKILAHKLERAEAMANAECIDARKALNPNSDAAWFQIAGTYAMFDGPSSPLTQSFGLGMGDPITAETLLCIEQFFHKHDAPLLHEVSPLADPSLLCLLPERGYRPIEFSNVLYRSLDEALLIKDEHAAFTTRIINSDERDVWAQTASQGWSTYGDELAASVLDFGKVTTHCEHGFPFIAELNKKPVATGMMFIFDDIALLSGASTIPDARRAGAQTALLKARLHYAHEQGCTVAMICAEPGSQSQHNAEKNGFRVAYTRIKWQKFIK